MYAGDLTHAGSESDAVEVQPEATAQPSFTLNVNTASLTLKPGQSGSLVTTITPANGFTGFIALSCTGAPVSVGSTTNAALPYGVACNYTPANVQVAGVTTANPTGTVTADLTIQTTAPAGNSMNHLPSGREPLVLAVLFPGVLGLALLGRKRKLLGRVGLVLMLGMVALVGTTGCAARYGYFHHAPTANDGTPTGVYTITLTAQTSNGVTATENANAPVTMVLTVN